MSQNPNPQNQNQLENLVADTFAKLSDEQRNHFVDDTLSALINAIIDQKSKARFKRIMMKLQVRKQLGTKEQEWVKFLNITALVF